VISARLRDGATGLAASLYPRARRDDAIAVRDCAREAIDVSGVRQLPRESLSLAAAGLRARVGVAGRELAAAPWRAALELVALPLAAALLALWTFGFVPRYDHWPLGWGWMLLLGGSLAAVVGAALGARRVALAGAVATFAAAAAPHLGLGTTATITGIPSFFDVGTVDLGSASLLPNLLLIAGCLAMPPRPRREPRVIAARLALGILPAAASLLVLLPAPELIPASELAPPREISPGVLVGSGYNYPAPWVYDAPIFMRAFGIVLALAVVVSWVTARRHPAAPLASGLVLASVAYPLVWTLMHQDFTPWWAYDIEYRVGLSVLPLLLALALMRRAGRVRHGPPRPSVA